MSARNKQQRVNEKRPNVGEELVVARRSLRLKPMGRDAEVLHDAGWLDEDGKLTMSLGRKLVVERHWDNPESFSVVTETPDNLPGQERMPRNKTAFYMYTNQLRYVDVVERRY